MRKQVDGILLLDKHAGTTSNGILQRVKYLFNAKKAGHTGSLDPIATGMLPLCFGEATKFSQFLLESDKSYRVVARLGIRTTTADSEGEVIAERPVTGVSVDRIHQILPAFLHEIEQIPPMYSAIKHQGEPLYKLARRGIEIERKPRRVTIYSLQLENLTSESATFHVHCSKGTYVRTLVDDIGQALGCGAHVTALRRLTVSPYANAPMFTFSTLEDIAGSQGHDALMACLLPTETALQALPAITLSTVTAFYLRSGQPVRIPDSLHVGSPLVRLLADDLRFIGIGEVMTDGRIKPKRLASVCAKTG